DVEKMLEPDFKHTHTFPPHNIIRLNENQYMVELAVAGFARQDIDITFEDNKLIVSGKTEDDNSNFLFKGIANRAFTRTFFLDDTIEINDAAMMNGMLKIALEKIIPEHKKPKKIAVNDGETKPKSKKTLLNENDTYV
ncbi:MAG: hypothetical protein EBY80_16135, partial [Actinobacteria bacterium]|nr:hypothetical protein [Actinomycetota bacterium]